MQIYLQNIFSHKMHIPVAKRNIMFFVQKYFHTIFLFVQKRKKFKLSKFAQIDHCVNSCTNVLRLVSAIETPRNEIAWHPIYSEHIGTLSVQLGGKNPLLARILRE